MKIDLIRNLQHQCPELELLLSVIEDDKNDFWLIGGCLRDLLMNRSVQDVDLVSSADPTPLAKKWSGLVNGRWFWLDQDRLHSRVLLSNSVHVDFSPLKADTLEKDLELRDFTINSMALSCSDLTQLIDPFNGYKEIGTGCVRPTSERSFVDDPLRMLKGIRHAVTLDMVCPPETITLIQKHAKLIAAVSGERIRDELMLILTSDDPVSGLDLLWKSGLLAVLLPFEQKQVDIHWGDLLDGLAELCTKLNGMKTQWSEIDQSLLKDVKLMNLQALYLLVQVLVLLQPENLGELLHHRLRLGRYEQRLIEALIAMQDRDDFDLFWLNTKVCNRSKALMVEQFEPFSLEKMIYISLFDEHLNLCKCVNLYRCFSALQVAGRIPDLLSGLQVQEITACPEAAIGLWHKKLKEAEINGKIASASDAKSWLKKQNSI